MTDLNSTPSKLIEAKQSSFDWAHFSLGLGLLAIVAVFDAYRFFNAQWSTLYLLVVLYAWWFLRDRAELLLYVAVTAAEFLVPIISRPEMRLFNRTTGAIAGWIVILAMRDSRRSFIALKRANDELESKVIVRTTELRASQQRLEALSRQLITTQESERSNLARELHDEFGQVLAAMKMNIRRIEQTPQEKKRAVLDENISMIDRCISQVRDITLNLRPPQLDELGLGSALSWYLKKQARIAGFDANLVITPAEIQFSRELNTVCFRIAQEAVTNAIKHAAPTQIEIKLNQDNDELHLKIHDNGKGFDVEKAIAGASNGTSFGLSGMMERVALANGQIEIQSSPGYGSTIHTWFRLSPESHG